MKQEGGAGHSQYRYSGSEGSQEITFLAVSGREYQRKKATFPEKSDL